MFQLGEILEESILQRRFQLPPAFLDRVHIGRIRRQADEVDVLSVPQFGDFRRPKIRCSIEYEDEVIVKFLLSARTNFRACSPVIPWGHVHVHLNMATYEYTTRAGTCKKLIDKGHLTVLDDPEIRDVAKKHGDPEELLDKNGVRLFLAATQAVIILTVTQRTR